MRPTLSQLLALTILLQQGVLAVAWIGIALAGYSRRAVPHTAAGCALLALTVVALLLRSQMPLAANALLPVALGVASLMVLRRGVQVFGHAPPADREQALVFAAFMGAAAGAFFVPAEPGCVGVSALTSLTLAYTLLATARDGVRLLGPEFGRVAAWGCIAPFAVLGVLFALRALSSPWIVRRPPPAAATRTWTWLSASSSSCRHSP